MGKRGKNRKTEADVSAKGGNDADTKKESGDKAVETSRYPQREHDPDGSLGVAVGVMSAKDAVSTREALLEGKSSQDRALIEKYLEGPNAYQQKQRQKMLRNDDAQMNTDKLNGYQKRALQKRRKASNRKSVVASLEVRETKRVQAAAAAADAQTVLHTETPGLLEAENDMERTRGVTQKQLAKHLSEQTAQHIYDLRLPNYAPYGMKYDRSGRWALLYGSRGHLALMDCHVRRLKTEFHVGEQVRDTTFLHNSSLFAAAQSNNVFIYDDNGAEIHRLSDHIDPMRLDFLPYHWLLVSVGRAGWLRYHDTSTGELVVTHRTKMGPCQAMRQNPSNAVMHLGHTNGTVTLWSPSTSRYLVKMLCHHGAPITSIAVDRGGHYMVTGAADQRVKVWDLRNYKRCLTYHTCGGVPSSMDFSQRGILGIGHAGQATFWSPEVVRTKLKESYMHHLMGGCSPVETLRFRPFEDVCGVGHTKGISSIVIPGSGEPNLDSMEYNTNPYQDQKQRREAEVRALLDKLSPDMIALDPDVVASVEASNEHIRLERLRDIEDDKNAKVKPTKKQKSKKRGRSKIQTQLRRKERKVNEENTDKLRQSLKEDKAAAKGNKNPEEAFAKQQETLKDKAPSALKRFF